jgi:hypothetical protein
MANKRHISPTNILSHPLILLLVGAGITGLLVPDITNQWQNHQKELELKTDLANQISRAVANMIISARLIQITGFISSSDYGSAYVAWETAKSSIGSQIEAYFPNTEIKQEWDNLSAAVTDFVNLNPELVPNKNPSEYAAKVCTRINHVLNVKEYLEPNNRTNINRTDLSLYGCQNPQSEQQIQKYSSVLSDVNWRALIYKDKYFGNQTYIKNWLVVEKLLQNQREKLIGSILRAPISSF